MNTAFGELAQAHERKQRRRQHRLIVSGLLLMGLGYAAMAVPAHTDVSWAFVRVCVGLACIVTGFGLAAWPVLSRWTDRQ